MDQFKEGPPSSFKKCLGILVLCLIMASLATGRVSASPMMDQVQSIDLSPEALDRLITDYISERSEGTAGLSLGVYKDGQVIYKKHHGYMDVENQIKADKQSIYEWGSVSKVLIWVSVMQLKEAGKVDLDSDVRHYFSDEINRQLQFQKTVSLRQLMNHQGGFQEVTYPVEFSKAEDLVDFGDLLMASEPPQIYKPGTVTAYNNWSAALAAYVIENVAGVPFDQYVHENIFSNLDMDHTALRPDWSDNPFVQENRQHSKAYYYTAETKESLGPSIVHIGLYPAGACCGTLDDFLKFTAAFTDPETKLFQNPQTLSEMLEASSTYSNGDDRNHHGLWSLDCGSHVIGHSGNTQGFTATFFFDPESRIGYAVMTNEVGETAYNYGLAEVLFGKYIGEVKEGPDISGIYYSKRTIERGCARMIKYLSMILPIIKTEDPGLFRMALDPDMTFSHYGKQVYRQDNHNGLAFNMVKINDQDYLESYVTDMEKIPTYKIGIVLLCLLGMVSIILSLIPSIILYVLNRKRKKTMTGPQKINYLAQIAAITISLIFFYMWMFIPDYSPSRIFPLCMISSVLALLLLANFFVQLYNNFKQVNKWGDLVKASLLLIPVLSVVFFQLYNFWS